MYCWQSSARQLAGQDSAVVTLVVGLGVVVGITDASHRKAL